MRKIILNLTVFFVITTLTFASCSTIKCCSNKKESSCNKTCSTNLTTSNNTKMKNETCHKCGKSSCDKNCSENLSLPNGMSEKLCTSKSTQELKTEEEAFKKLDVFKKISFVKEIETGYEFIYENLSDKLAIELIDFLKLERKCCPTYNYALHVDSKSKTIRYQRFGSQQIKDELKIYLQHIGLLP